MPYKSTITGTCPGGFCDFIKDNSEVLIILLCIEAFIFFVTLVPPLFNWSTKKPDGRKRIYFAALACITFYFWLVFLGINSVYCFGFLAHQGPCRHNTLKVSTTVANNEATLGNSLVSSTASASAETTRGSPKISLGTSTKQPISPIIKASPSKSSLLTSSLASSSRWTPLNEELDTTHSSPISLSPSSVSLSSALFGSSVASSPTVSGSTQNFPPTPQALTWGLDKNCSQDIPSPVEEHQAELKNLTVVNILILVVLFVVLLANAKEGKTSCLFFTYMGLLFREQTVYLWICFIVYILMLLTLGTETKVFPVCICIQYMHGSGKVCLGALF